MQKKLKFFWGLTEHKHEVNQTQSLRCKLSGETSIVKDNTCVALVIYIVFSFTDRQQGCCLQTFNGGTNYGHQPQHVSNVFQSFFGDF